MLTTHGFVPRTLRSTGRCPADWAVLECLVGYLFKTVYNVKYKDKIGNVVYLQHQHPFCPFTGLVMLQDLLTKVEAGCEAVFKLETALVESELVTSEKVFLPKLERVLLDLAACTDGTSGVFYAFGLGQHPVRFIESGCFDGFMHTKVWNQMMMVLMTMTKTTTDNDNQGNDNDDYDYDEWWW